MRQEVLDHMRAALALWKELEALGYHCGGWDAKTNTDAIFKGRYPNATYVGYVDHETLQITWKYPEDAEMWAKASTEGV